MCKPLYYILTQTNECVIYQKPPLCSFNQADNKELHRPTSIKTTRGLAYGQINVTVQHF